MACQDRLVDVEFHGTQQEAVYCAAVLLGRKIGYSISDTTPNNSLTYRKSQAVKGGQVLHKEWVLIVAEIHNGKDALEAGVIKFHGKSFKVTVNIRDERHLQLEIGTVILEVTWKEMDEGAASEGNGSEVSPLAGWAWFAITSATAHNAAVSKLTRNLIVPRKRRSPDAEDPRRTMFSSIEKATLLAWLVSRGAEQELRGCN